MAPKLLNGLSQNYLFEPMTMHEMRYYSHTRQLKTKKNTKQIIQLKEK